MHPYTLLNILPCKVPYTTPTPLHTDPACTHVSPLSCMPIAMLRMFPRVVSFHPPISRSPPLPSPGPDLLEKSHICSELGLAHALHATVPRVHEELDKLLPVDVPCVVGVDLAGWSENKNRVP